MMKRPNKKIKGYLVTIALFFVVLNITLFGLMIPRKAEAGIPVIEVGANLAVNIANRVWNSLQKALKISSDVVFKNVLTNYVNNYAYNVAVKVATGKSGQKPLITPNPSELLQDTADVAAGDFLDTLARDIVGGTCNSDSNKRCTKDSDCSPIVGTVNGVSMITEVGQCIPSSFSLCDKTNYQLQAKLQGWARAYVEGKPAKITSTCPLSSIIDNVQATQHQKLIELSKSFNPEANEVGMYGTILNNMMGKIAAEVTGKTFQKLLEGEFESVTTPISGTIKTPASVISGLVNEIPSATIQSALTYTGTSLADIGASGLKVFGNTLASKLIEKLFSTKPGGGLNPSASTPSSTSGFAGTAGVTAAKAQFASFKETNYTTGGDVDILNELASCPDKNDPLPTTCVIDNNFQSAIQQELTVREALDQGLLSGTKTFGYDSNGREPDYLSGYPYRSLVILRTYRVIPVGWELAAQYIKKYGAGNYSLNTLIQEYGNQSSPFYHLIDPNWVLKAPGVFCKKVGAGEKISSTQTIRGDDTNYDGSINMKDIATTSIQREDYCADTQTCIAENSDGSCIRYGYCIEEKPIYKFNGTECQAQNNTCQSFTRRSGETVSYLQNSLTYNNCSANNAGCGWYCQNYNTNTGQWQCSNVPPVIMVSGQPDKIAFTQKAESCQASAEGCHEYVSISNSGANLLANSDFETFRADAANYSDGVKDSSQPDAFPGWTDDGIATLNSPCSLRMEAVSDSFGGSTAARLKNYAPDCIDNFIESTVNTGYAINNRLFTVSLYAKKDTADHNADCSNQKTLTVQLRRGSEAVQTLGTITLSSDWTRYTGSKLFMAGSNASDLKVLIGRNDNVLGSDECDYFIDNVQLEEGNLTDYKTYENSPKTYLKKTPSYLSCTGNPATDPAACSSYAQSCSADEIGCQEYTSQTNGDVVTGVVSSALACSPNDPSSCDQCPSQYVGCRAYREMAIDHTPQRPLRDPVSFIASTGATCSAAAVGCEEYTNLETAANGGEGKEYYSLIRQCVDTDDASAATYYTWEGSDEFGYQLKSYKLKTSNLAGSAPCTNMDPAGWPACSDSANPADENYAYDCSADFGTNPDCTQFYNASGSIFYRLKSKIIHASVDCTPYRNTIDGTAITYHMIPGQGVACSAVQAGCREYKGNSGDNVRTVYTTTFESGSVLPWFENITYSNESVQVGGHSMLIANSARYPNVGSTLGMKAGSTYYITFWAKAAATDTNIVASVQTAPVATFSGEARARTGEWSRFQLGPLYIPRGSDLSAIALRINSDNAFYIDNITIRESTDSLYLIKDSYKECSGYENCDQYVDGSQSVQYLKSFTRLCSPDKVGCEAMIDTQNSSSPFATEYALNTTVPITHVTVSADRPVLLVNDPKKQCTAAEKGCQLFGQPVIDQDEQVTSYTNVFLRNDPDQYINTLCAYEEQGCEAFTTSGGGTSYFKYPGDRTCEYKRVAGQQTSGWYQKGTESGPPDCPIATGWCSSTSPENAGGLCNADSDCGAGGDCQESQSIVAQPVDGYTGICPAEESGCTEIRDPEDPALCDASVHGDCKSYYYIDNTLDKTSCNGLVNRDEGCRLFNDTSSTSLNYSVANSKNGQSPAVCDPADLGDCAANALIQVRNDRVCGKWLECQTSWQVTNKDGKTEDMCMGLSVCDRKDDQSGNCVDITSQSQVNETYNMPAYVDQIKNYSGLVTAGLEWGQRCNNNQNIICSVRHCTGNDSITCDDNATCAAAGAGTCRSSNDECRRCTLDSSRYCSSDTDCPANAGTCPAASVASCSVPQVIQGDFPYSKMQEIGLGGAASLNDLVPFGDFGDSNDTVNKLYDRYLVGAVDIDQDGNTTGVDEAAPDNPITSQYFASWHALNANGGTATLEMRELSASGGAESSNLDENNVLHVTAPQTGTGAYFNLMKTVVAGTDYTVSFKLKLPSLPNSGDSMIVRLDYTNGQTQNFDTISLSGDVSTAWKEYSLGPITARSYPTEVHLNFIYQYGSSGQRQTMDFYLDNVSMKPLLEVRRGQCVGGGNNGNSCITNSDCPGGTCQDDTRLTRSCRMYPESDAQYCSYVDENGTTHIGWNGYCITRDSQNPKYCLSWWPVDLLSGESNIFSNQSFAGYTGEKPLYYCARADGNYNVSTVNSFRGSQSVDDDDPHSGNLGACISHGACGCGRRLGIDMCGEGDCGSACSPMGSGHYGLSWVGDTTGSVGVTLAAQDQVWQYEVESIGWRVGVNNDGILASHDDWGDVRLNLNRGNNWRDTWTGPSSCDSGNTVTVTAVWTSINGMLRLTGFSSDWNDGSCEWGGAQIVPTIYLKSVCTDMVQAVNLTDEPVVWSQRINQTTYALDGILYQGGQDYNPYGRVVRPSIGILPSTWTYASGTGPLLVERRSNPGQYAHAGSPYTCNGMCEYSHCNWDNYLLCIDDTTTNTCISHNGANDGYCNGMNIVSTTGGGAWASNRPLGEGVDRLKHLFASAYSGWTWNESGANAGTYTQGGAVDTAVQNWRNADFYNMRVCANNTRPADYSSEYCGVLPTANNFSVGSGNQQGTSIRVREAQLVQLSFNLNANVEQVPIREIDIYWGDSEQPQPLQGYFTNGTIVVSHAYDLVGSIPTSFVPRIQIQDNWGFCSNTTMTGTGTERQRSCDDQQRCTGNLSRTCNSDSDCSSVGAGSCGYPQWKSTGITVTVSP